MEIKMTKRETEICKYLVQGLKNDEIAKILHISKHTVKAYVSMLIYDTNVKNRTELAFILGKNNLF